MYAEQILTTAARYISRSITDILFSRIKAPSVPEQEIQRKSEKLQICLNNHLSKAVKWSEGVQFFIMPSPKNVDNDTLPLSFSSIPRKFCGAGSVPEVYDESFLVNSVSNFLVLGPPGSGKTTTLKRLLRKSLFEELTPEHNSYRAPLLIRLREFNSSFESPHPLLMRIAREIGLDCELKKAGEAKRFVGIKNKVIRFVAYCENEPIEELIPRLLHEMRYILYLDGLDEVTSEIREEIEDDIACINSLANSCKLVLTCRSGEYKRPHAHMSAVEVCDLSDSEIYDIAGKWLNSDLNSTLLP